MQALTKNIRISPKKLQVVVSCVQGRPVQEALNILKFMPKKGARLLYKVVYSALSNAVQNNSQEKEDLFLHKIEVSKWVVYKRGQPISRGRYHPTLKRTSNIRVELSVF